jgi:tRNA(fMet)-specific endonuclease VapC
MWMLDTNTCSYVLRRHPLAVKARFDQIGPDHLAISTVVLAELLFGAARHPTKGVEIRQDIDDMASRLAVMPWSARAADEYSQLRTFLERQGTPIGTMDMMIAAHALAENAVLVTNNLREFSRVPNLRLENWMIQVE